MAKKKPKSSSGDSSRDHHYLIGIPEWDRQTAKIKRYGVGEGGVAQRVEIYQNGVLTWTSQTK